MDHFFGKLGRSLFIFSIFIGSVACDPVPSKPLTSSQKRADMAWLYSQFDENYAPLDFKVEKYGLDYEKLKSDYLERAAATPDNDSFYHTMEEFVAEFRDAHTTASMSDGGFPNRVKVAFLGFSGKRKGNAFVVTEILPTSKGKKSHFPIHVGDEIISLNGKLLPDLIQKELIQLENLGNSESNLTFHMNRLFNRISTSSYFPKENDAIIGVKKLKTSARDAFHEKKKSDTELEIDDLEEDSFEEVKITLPWIIKDIFDFRKEQKAATLQTAPEKDKKSERSPASADFFSIGDQDNGINILLGLRGFDGSLQLPSAALARSLRNREGYGFLDSFYFPNSVESWTSDILLSETGAPSLVSDSTLNQLKKVRKIPEKARFITPDQATFPTYITSEEDHFEKKKLVATLYLNTFSPSQSSSAVIEEFKKTLENLEFYGVQELIIDMINNGGGSLSLGMKLAQALSSEKVEMPAIQFIASQSWMNQFQLLSREAPSDAEKELASRLYNELEEVHRENDRRPAGSKIIRLTRPQVLDQAFMPFELKPNTALKNKLKIVVLVNEMCASMCDIFAGILQDNHMATILGSQTMGAGGNVVDHYEAPNSHLVVRQTESLMLRRVVKPNGKVKLGSYIENLGITPDVTFEVNKHSQNKYTAVRTKALEVFKENDAKVGEKRKR